MPDNLFQDGTSGPFPLTPTLSLGEREKHLQLRVTIAAR